MIDINASRTLLSPHDLTFLAGAPYVYHCHHYNLFHDQTVDDVLGDEEGAALRQRAASSAMHDLLAGLCRANALQTPAERIQAGQWLLAAMGQGKVQIDATAEGGTATGNPLHYGFAWKEKYGARIKRQFPADMVAAGFCSAVIEVAFDLPKGAIHAVQEACIAMRDPEARFRFSRVAPPPPQPVVDLAAFQKVLGASEGGLHEERIAHVASTLQQFMTGVGGDARGLVEAFGVYVTMHLGNYYNETAFEAVRAAEVFNPDLVPLAESLFREAGHVCVFNTFSNILLSPEWESVAGPLKPDPLEIILGCLAIARGLGFGRWALQEYEPGKRLVMSSTSNYEAPFWLARYGKSDRPRSLVFKGAALAIMVIATRMKLWERPVLDAEGYDQLFRGEGLGFRAELTECQSMGAERTVAVVTAV